MICSRCLKNWGMRSNYKRLGNYIKLVEGRNTVLQTLPLMGLSITKKFIPSISNLVGTDMTTYRTIIRNQFAYSPVTSRNGDKITIALFEDHDKALISQAYTPFEVIDKKELLPEYLMMWFRRTEFDRYARFMSHGSARELFGWEDFCDMQLPIPSIAKQKEIVKEYNVIQNRIALNKQLIQKLEETAQAIYKQWFVDFDEDNLEMKNLGDLCSLITDGKHGDCIDELNSGYYFVSVKDLSNGEIIYDNARQITKKDFDETHRRTSLSAGDILLTNAGTIGRMAIVKAIPETSRTTFQKSVAILRPKNKVAKSYYLYLLLKFHLREIIDLAGGSTQSNLLLGDLRNYKIKYPNYEAICALEKNIMPIFQLVEIKGMEIKKSIMMRDLLLSKLATLEN